MIYTHFKCSKTYEIHDLKLKVEAVSIVKDRLKKKKANLLWHITIIILREFILLDRPMNKHLMVTPLCALVSPLFGAELVELLAGCLQQPQTSQVPFKGQEAVH